jgi:uncharacterized protein YfaA (DUF2138 family)
MNYTTEELKMMASRPGWYSERDRKAMKEEIAKREAPPMTPERVKQTGRQFGQKIGAKEAKAIARVLAPRPWDAGMKRPGEMAAEYAEETGVSYSEALVACNMD